VVVHGWLLTTAAFVKEDTGWLRLFPFHGGAGRRSNRLGGRRPGSGRTPNVSFV